MQYSTIQSNPMQSTPMQCNAIQSTAIQSNPIQYHTIQYNTIQYNFLSAESIKLWYTEFICVLLFSKIIVLRDLCAISFITIILREKWLACFVSSDFIKQHTTQTSWKCSWHTTLKPYHYTSRRYESTSLKTVSLGRIVLKKSINIKFKYWSSRAESAIRASYVFGIWFSSSLRKIFSLQSYSFSVVVNFLRMN